MPHLLAFGHASVYNRVLDFGTSAKLIALFLNLNRKFSCRCKDKYDRPFARLEILLCGKSIKAYVKKYERKGRKPIKPKKR